MAITAGDIEFRYSTKSGAAGDSTASDGASSLGKYMSTSQYLGALNSLFDKITGAENAASTVFYRCIFVTNTHSTDSWTGIKVWLSGVVAGGADVAISVDTTTASAAGSASAQAKEIANETTAPSAQSFTAPTSEGTGLDLGDLDAGECRAIWIRVTATNSGGLASDGATIEVKGDSV